MKQAALFTLLALVPSIVQAAPAVQRPAAMKLSPEHEQAQDLYQEGTGHYEAADYPKAIEAFTAALNLSSNAKIRGTLMLNIALAHTKQFDIDRDLQHLRQAKAIYQRYLDQATDAGYSEDDQADASEALEKIEIKLRMARQIQDNRERAKARPIPPPPPTVGDPKRRKLGIGFVAGGSVLVAGGVSVLAVGATYKPRAETEADKFPEATNGQEYIDLQTKRGTILMGVGGGVAALGVVGLVVGAVQMHKNKPSKVAVTPFGGQNTAGLSISGRF